MNQTQILFQGEKSALNKNPVESFPVLADKKLSTRTDVVGNFSLIPTNVIYDIGLIGNVKFEAIRVPTTTKYARKDWSVTAKW